MKEQDLQKKIIDYLEQDGCYVVKVITANKNGIPDIIFCKNGKYGAVEVKKPGAKLSVLQEYNKRKITFAGGLFFAANNYEQFKYDYTSLSIEGRLL